MVLVNLGGVCCDMGNFAQARDNFKKALEIIRRMHGEKHPQVAIMLYNIATMLHTPDQFDEALKLYRKSLKIRRRFQGNHTELADTLSNMGSIYHAQGKHEEALEMYDEAREIYTSALVTTMFTLRPCSSKLPCPNTPLATWPELCRARRSLCESSKSWAPMIQPQPSPVRC